MNNALIKLKKEEKEKRKEIILGAAQKLFSKRGISDVNMRDIAKGAGVSVGFIYRYFSGRTDIFVELFEEGAAGILEKLDAEIYLDSPRLLQRIGRTYVNHLHENMMFFEMMTHFMLEGDLSGSALNRVNGVLRRIVDRVETVFKNGQKAENSRILAHCFFASLNGVMISLVKYPGRSQDEVRKRTLLLADTISRRFDEEHNVA